MGYLKKQGMSGFGAQLARAISKTAQIDAVPLPFPKPPAYARADGARYTTQIDYRPKPLPKPANAHRATASRQGYLSMGDSSAPPAGVSLPTCPTNVDGWCIPGPGMKAAYVGIGAATITADQVKKESSTASKFVSGFLAALTGGFGTNTMTPPAQQVVVAPSSGPSTTTIVAIGGAALLAVILLTD